MPTKKKPKRIRFSGHDTKSSENIHDRAEQVARIVMAPLKKDKWKKKKEGIENE